MFDATLFHRIQLPKKGLINVKGLKLEGFKFDVKQSSHLPVLKCNLLSWCLSFCYLGFHLVLVLVASPLLTAASTAFYLVTTYSPALTHPIIPACIHGPSFSHFAARFPAVSMSVCVCNKTLQTHPSTSSLRTLCFVPALLVPSVQFY